jgi:pimeloyl-ACP methyl ester carboxylesterase
MAENRETVLLLHGLWMNSFAMLYLAQALGGEGYATETFDYHSMRGTLPEHVAALAERVAATDGATVHLVAHSLGGIVALHYLQGERDRRLGRVVLLGSPVGGSQAARALGNWPAGELLLGRSVDIWQSDSRPRLDGTVGVGAIAGSSPFGLGSIFMDVPEPSDGVVTVDETRLPGLADHLVLPVSHSGMLMSGDIVRQTAAFLRTGRFER